MCFAAATAKPQATAFLQRVRSKQLRESEPTTVPVTEHQKAAGNGYLAGSPLYDKQEYRKDRVGYWFKQNGHKLVNINEMSIWEWLGQLVVETIIFLILAYLYTLWKPEVTMPPSVDGRPWSVPYANENPSYCGGFQFSLCGCFDNIELCLTACCCSSCRWAHTVHLASIWPYWTAVVIMGMLEILSPLGPLTVGFCGLIALAVATKARQDLRTKMGFRNVGGATMIMDCCTYCWCGWPLAPGAAVQFLA